MRLYEPEGAHNVMRLHVIGAPDHWWRGPCWQPDDDQPLLSLRDMNVRSGHVHGEGQGHGRRTRRAGELSACRITQRLG